MRGRKLWAIGGFVAGGLLILFGVAALYLEATSYVLVGDELSKEKIVGGQDMSPEAIQEGIDAAELEDVEAPDCNVVDEEIDTGEEARCFGQYMRIHALEATGGLTYAEMGRFQSADDPAYPAGTKDEAEAAKDEQGNPVSNGQRNIWINETALSTALNVSYMAEQISIFGIVVGIALLLTGIGLLLLAYAVFLRERPGVPPPGSSAQEGAVSGAGSLSALALLAQLVEHLHGKEGVDGSSPSEGSRNPRKRGISAFGRESWCEVLWGRFSLPQSGAAQVQSRSPRPGGEARVRDRLVAIDDAAADVPEALDGDLLLVSYEEDDAAPLVRTELQPEEFVGPSELTSCPRRRSGGG